MDKLERATQLYQQLKDHLDAHGIKYTPHDNDQVITLTAQGEDFPIPLIIRVIGEIEILRISSPIPGNFPEDKRIDAAVAVATINDQLMIGTFTLDMNDGSVAYRICHNFHDNDISEEQIRYLITAMFKITDDFNDSLFLLSKGMITLDQFIEKTQH